MQPVFFFDPPQALAANVTNIPGSGSAPLQVVANSIAAATGIFFIDTTGDFIGVFIGTVGSEQQKCIVGGGQTNTISCLIPLGSRVSLRSVTSMPITNGTLCCVFLGSQQYYTIGAV